MGKREAGGGRVPRRLCFPCAQCAPQAPRTLRDLPVQASADATRFCDAPCASDAAARVARAAAPSADVACVAPPAERFAGKNDWWAYAAAAVLLVAPAALTLAGLSALAALACMAVLALLTVPRLVRNWVDLYADRFVAAFGFRTVTVRVAQVVEVREESRLALPTANARACVCVAVRASGTKGGCQRELRVALRDNARFAAELSERRRRLRCHGS